jgi:CheY-like chemotaxis protein
MAKRCILVVEDDLDIRNNLKELFEIEGYPVTTAQHGKEALEVLEGMVEAPGLILLDLMMPVMDGHAFLAELVRRKQAAGQPKPPVVIISASRASMPEAADDFIRKPPQIDALLETAEKYCG